MLFLGRQEVEALLDLDQLIEAPGPAMVELSAGAVSIPQRPALIYRLSCWFMQRSWWTRLAWQEGFRFVKGEKSEWYFLRALGWFRELGLEEARAHTFAGDAHAPLSDDQRSALQSLFRMRWPGVEAELTEEEWMEFQRLCLPESADFILDRPDYYAFFTYTMFQGKVV